jgi:hypothetical protein
MTNPLLDFSDLPRFDQIRPEHVAPAMDDLLASAESALATVTAPDFPAKWTSIATVLDVATERLGRAWGAVSHLNSVADTPELRAAYNAVLPKVTEFWTRLGADERLFAKYKAIDPSQLNPSSARPTAMRCATSCSVAPSSQAPTGSALPASRSARPNWRRNSAKTRSTPPTLQPTTPPRQSWMAYPRREADRPRRRR